MRTRISLNGPWQVSPGTRDLPPALWQGEVPVPGLLDLAMPPYDWAAHEYHWYRTLFTLPADVPFSNALLRIDQAMFGTSVRLNGIPVGSDIGCYTSQEYDLRQALRRDGENELLVRVGLKSTLPPESAVGADQERTEFIPGIWGDVALVLTGNPRIRVVQVIPHIDTGIAEARISVENTSASHCQVTVTARVRDKSSGTVCSSEEKVTVDVKGNGEYRCTLELPIASPTLWSPDNPFLYELDASIHTPASTLQNPESKIHNPGTHLPGSNIQNPESRIHNLQSPLHHPALDRLTTSFGMREFRVAAGDFLLNGKKILLRGGNIAFHRFLSDADRGTLPWDMQWVKKLLIDIPKAHNFNFFRSHIGQMYNRWYDIADEHGMLLQNEWQFWTTTGTKEQITKEFTRWLEDNWNHPSIVIWDALNECSDDVVQKEVVPAMKQLDPTRPWESVDFVEQHPYIYSLGPVLNDRQFGFTAAMEEIASMKAPSVLNEFLWWWLDKDWKPTVLTRDVITRWLGRDYTKEDLIERQSFLAQELVGLFRRMGVDAIQPFVYLSNNAGPTANWFDGDVKDLRPKPVMKALRNAFAPFGVSIELWDRHFFPGEHRAIRFFLFNDTRFGQTGMLHCGIVDAQGKWVFESEQEATVGECGVSVVTVTICFPANAGSYGVRAELLADGKCLSYSQKPAHVIEETVAGHLEHCRVALLEEETGIGAFLESRGIPVVPFATADIRSCSLVVASGRTVSGEAYRARLEELTEFLHAGKSVIIIEPEFGIGEPQTVRLAPGTPLQIERREDVDRGGYDSYVFAEDNSHPLWKGIDKEHLKMFNGGYGGEVVSAHSVIPDREHSVLARCGLDLNVAAVMEIPYGRGKIIVSRLQLRGRLSKGVDHRLYDRRADPVMQRYLLNLLSYAST